MADFLFSLMSFIIVLFPLVMIHELGHYWAARRCGVHVEVFSIGMGPKLWGWTDKAGTHWKICALFLGGYVKMKGDGDIASSRPAPATSAKELEGNFFTKPPLQRIFVALAGPFMNYLTAFLLVFALNMGVGTQEYRSTLGAVTKTGIGFKGGLREGDRILSIQSVPTPTRSSIFKVLEDTPSSQPLHVDVQRQENVLAFTLTHPEGSETKSWMGSLGISYDMGACYYSGPLSIGESLKNAGDFVLASFRVLKAQSISHFQGPLGIAHQAFLIFHKGFFDIIFFMAHLSAGLGMLNILPIPLLDGGNVLLTIVEWVRRKPLSEKLQNVVFMVAFLFLAGFFILLSWQDLKRLLP